MPVYLSGMAPYEVRALTGLYSPDAGNETLQDVTPAEWRTNDPGVIDLRGVIDAWCGGGKSTSPVLLLTGGGHNDSANNGVYAYDFNGDTRPLGWRPPVISAVSAVRPANATYSDGRPTSIHSYDGLVTATHNNTFYRFAGALWAPAGGFTNGAFKLDLATGQWTRLPDVPGGGGVGLSVYDPGSGKILVNISGSFSASFLRTSNDTWSAVKTLTNVYSESVGLWDATRNRAFFIGSGNNRFLSIDFAAETLSQTSFTATGATAILGDSAPSAFHDPDRDVYWIFGGRFGSPGYTTLYEMNPTTFAVTAHPLSQSMAGGLPQDHQGSYGRFVFLRPWRAIGFVTRHDRAPWVIKLP